MLVMIMVILCTWMRFRLKARRFLLPCDCWVWLKVHSNPETAYMGKSWMDGWMTVLGNPAICLCAYALLTNSMFRLFFKRLSETNQEMICSVFSIAGPLSRCRAGGVAEQGNESSSCLLNLPAWVKPSSFFMPCKNCGKWDVCCHLLTLLFLLSVATLQHIWLNMQARSCNAVKCINPCESHDSNQDVNLESLLSIH